MSLKVYNKFLIILSNASLQKAELFSNYRKLYELELKKDCGIFS